MEANLSHWCVPVEPPRRVSVAYPHQVDSVEDVTREQLQTIKEKRTHDPKILLELRKRKLLKMQKIISFEIAKGDKFALEIVKEETDLTVDLLTSGSWKSATFSEYSQALMALQFPLSAP